MYAMKENNDHSNNLKYNGMCFNAFFIYTFDRYFFRLHADSSFMI